MNAKLKAISDHAAANLIGLIHDGEKKILEAWAQAEEEAQLQDSKPKFKLNLAITLDLDKNKMETDLSFAIKHTLGCVEDMPDPDQLEMSIQVGSRPPVKVDPKKVAALAKKHG